MVIDYCYYADYVSAALACWKYSLFGEPVYSSDLSSIDCDGSEKRVCAHRAPTCGTLECTCDKQSDADIVKDVSNESGPVRAVAVKTGTATGIMVFTLWHAAVLAFFYLRHGWLCTCCACRRDAQDAPRVTSSPTKHKPQRKDQSAKRNERQRQTAHPGSPGGSSKAKQSEQKVKEVNKGREVTKPKKAPRVKEALQVKEAPQKVKRVSPTKEVSENFETFENIVIQK
ncbi:uncharacterized protein LOC113238957 [Hyposmocoma kahamanoa]|uniref:uncharacterized protein LOC113238957 n=1 Tax=Hyposmocoma kahamanoa TaxID=1477025 RepID=UPI000E6D7BB3|nr:uncharacterized protein LOC113238957 [Hyposmocoma kahamanoa]